MRTIKRYQNRKLYDTEQHCYISLSELGEIMQTNDVRVIDNKTKNDITYQTQLQVLFDMERKSPNTNNQVVKNVITSNQTLTDYIKNLEKNLDLTKTVWDNN